MNGNTLGDIVRSLRKRANMTQEELAEGICSPVSVSRIENGVQMPSGTVLEALLSRLGTSTYQLCNIYYKNDKQLIFEQEADRVAELLRLGKLSEAKSAMDTLEKPEDSDSVNLQYYMLLSAAIMLMEEVCADEVMSYLQRAIEITKGVFDYTDFRGTLLTVQEANILNLYSVAMFRSDKTMDAIRLGEELFLSLKKHESTVRGYNLLRINVAFNLAQYMEKEHRYREAMIYCQEAEALSLNSMEQALLPEIEFIKAKAYHLLGDDEKSCFTLSAIIPYMELIQKEDFAKLARSYARSELKLNI